MPLSVLRYISSFVRLIFPRICAGCNNDLHSGESYICLHCQQAMVSTDQVSLPENPMYALLRPSMPLEKAAAAYYYGSGLTIQKLMQEIKYNGNSKLAVHLGKDLGRYLGREAIWADIQCLIPVPLHGRKKANRGFNQSELLCRGMSEELHVPTIANVLIRNKKTPTQTNRSRTERWENVANAFGLKNAGVLEGKHIVLVDDVITTGATLLACSKTLMTIPGIRISIAALAYSGEL